MSYFIGDISIIVGLCLMLVGWIWSMIVARKISTGWFACVAFAGWIGMLLLAIKHWRVAKKPFIVFLIGIPLFFGVLFLL